MTAYFDSAAAEVREASERFPDREAFLAEVGEVERRVIRDVQLCTGDREFPGDLREKILGRIAVDATVGPLEATNLAPSFYGKARDLAAAARYSPLLDSLHSLFHRLAERRLLVRFGRWTDSPTDNLLRRDDHDDPGGAELRAMKRAAARGDEEAKAVLAKLEEMPALARKILRERKEGTT